MNKPPKNDWRDWLANLLGLNSGDRNTLKRLLKTLNRDDGRYVTAEEMNMIEGVLALRDVRVRDKMLTMEDVVRMSIDDDYQRAVDIVREHEHSRYPVVDKKGDTVRGILLAKELHKYTSAPDTFRMEDVMREPVLCPDSMPLENLLAVFRSTRSHMIIAQDEFGVSAGIITIENFLEHIVGDIRDESDEDEESDVIAAGHGRSSVKGTLSIEEFNRQFDADLPAGGDNIAGWLAAELERMPRVGDRHKAHGFLFEVRDADSRRVRRLMVSRRGD